MKKLQSYYIFKFNSRRLRESNYNLNITISEARSNDELVSLGDSLALRIVRKIKDRYVDQPHIDGLFLEKKKIKYQKSSPENQQRLLEIQNEIDSILFMGNEVISVVIDDNRHYDTIIKKGLCINGIKFVRFLCGAGNARRNTVIFIASDIEKEVKKILNNGRKEMPLVQQKFNAYFALANSASLEVTTPRFCVVPDYEIERITTIDWVEESEDGDTVEENTIPLRYNLWDGMGIVSPEFAKNIWSKDLGLDYTPSAFCIRGNFLKGMLCVFDFKRFSLEIAKKSEIIDAWGNVVNINDIDVICTTSQLKLWNGFDSCKQYVENCKKNNLTWGISRVTPRIEKTHVYSNYQFVQVLNLDDNQIENLCKKTVDYLNSVSGGDVRFTLLYLLGEMCDNEELPENWFESIQDPIVKALLLDNDLIHDPYIKQHIASTLNKKIRESYIGSLLLDGNYQVAVSDPYGFCEYIFGLPIKGLLRNKEHYSYYWNERNVRQVAAMRAPLTWRSEVNVLNLQENEETEKWFGGIQSGIIYNVHGVDCMLHADSDFDFDIICTTNQQEFIDGAYGGLPITYAKKSAPKKEIIEDELYNSDKLSFNSKIGFVTNCSTTLYSVLPLYQGGSKEYEEIIKRLKLCRKEQGSQIDKTKGIIIKEFPKNWTKRINIMEEMDEKEKEKAEFSNRLLIKKRPYFMNYLYPQYQKKNKKYNRSSYARKASIAYFGMDIDELILKKNPNSDEQEVLNEYYEYSPYIHSDSIMNKICKHMLSSIKEMRVSLRKNNFNYHRLMNNINLESDKLIEMISLFKEYKESKISHNTDFCEDIRSIDQFKEYLLDKANRISSEITELADLAIDVCYRVFPSANKEFAWKIFGEGIVQNLLKNNPDVVYVPLVDNFGDIKFLGKKYSSARYFINKG